MRIIIGTNYSENQIFIKFIDDHNHDITFRENRSNPQFDIDVIYLTKEDIQNLKNFISETEINESSGVV